MGILKSVFKNPPFLPIQFCEPITQYNVSFDHFFSTLLRGGRGYNRKIAQIEVFPIIFATDCR